MEDTKDVPMTEIDLSAPSAANGTPTILDNVISDVENGGLKKTDGSVDRSEQPKDRMARAKGGLASCMEPCLVKHNPLQDNANICERFVHYLRMPPHGPLATYIRFMAVSLALWVVLYCLTHKEALPGGNLYSLLVLFVCSAIGGYLISFVHLPPLLG